MQVQHQYALIWNIMKIEFENSIGRLSFLCRLPDIKIAWINACIITITVTVKINVIFRSNYFSFGISFFYFIPEISWLNHDPFVQSSQFFPPWFKFLTFFLFGAVCYLLWKGFCSFLSITEATVQYLFELS